jgi:NhaP-type Na+/H+ or K+/H+ antiporter
MLFGSLLGLVIIVAVLAMAIRILRQPVYRYQGDTTPNERRSFRETMVVWLMGPRG